MDRLGSLDSPDFQLGSINDMPLIPSVVGSTQANAVQKLQDAGLAVGIVTEMPHATIPAGSVVSATPAVGSTVDSASQVKPSGIYWRGGEGSHNIPYCDRHCGNSNNFDYLHPRSSEWRRA